MALIGASLDLGAGRRGVDMGPSAIRYAGLAGRIERLGRRVFDWGNELAEDVETLFHSFGRAGHTVGSFVFDDDYLFKGIPEAGVRGRSENFDQVRPLFVEDDAKMSTSPLRKSLQQTCSGPFDQSTPICGKPIARETPGMPPAPPK